MDMSRNNSQRGNVNLVGIIGFGAFVVVGGFLLSLLMPVILPEQASAQARNTDSLFQLLLGIGSGVFLLVQGLLVYSVIRFRAKPNDTSDGPSIHGNTTLEIVWTIIPSVIVAVLAILAFIVWNTNTAPQQNENMVNGVSIPTHALGQRFAWTFTYETPETDVNGDPIVVSSNELHTYVGQNVKLDMDTIDVIHSFWVPAMRVKQDLLPGRTTEVRFTPIATDSGFEYTMLSGPVTVVSNMEDGSTVQTIAEGETVQARILQTSPDGTMAQVSISGGADGWVPAAGLEGNGFNRYRLICTELCGGGHGQMYSWLVVHESEEAYLANFYNPQVELLREPPEDPYLLGQQVLNSGKYPCANCHILDSLGWAGITGPSLNGIGERAAERAATAGNSSAIDYLVQSIRQSEAYLVPGYGNLMPHFVPTQERADAGEGTYMPQSELDGIVAFLCAQVESGNPQDTACDLEFTADGQLADPNAALETLIEVSNQYE